MPYSITCSTESFTLATAPFLFIFVGVICEFAMVPGVYILLSPQEEEIHYPSSGHKCAHSAAHSPKIFKHLFTSCYYAKVVVNWKKHKQEIQLCYSACNETK